MKLTLLLIFAALAFMLGSFIWFVATWNAEAEEPVSFILPKVPPPPCKMRTHFITGEAQFASLAIASNTAPRNGTVGGAHLALPNSGARPALTGDHT